jgi:hypothetical protein
LIKVMILSLLQTRSGSADATLSRVIIQPPSAILRDATTSRGL